MEKNLVDKLIALDEKLPSEYEDDVADENLDALIEQIEGEVHLVVNKYEDEIRSLDQDQFAVLKVILGDKLALILSDLGV